MYIIFIFIQAYLLLVLPTLAQFVFYLEAEGCSGGISYIRNTDTSACIAGRSNTLYQSIHYQGNRFGNLEGYSSQREDHCAVYVTRDESCVDSGDYAAFTGAKFVRGPTNPCGEPSICLMDRKAGKLSFRSPYGLKNETYKMLYIFINFGDYVVTI